MLQRDAVAQRQRQELEACIRPIERRQREVQSDRLNLEQLAERGKDPAVQVRWTRARGWEIADRGRFREQVREFEERSASNMLITDPAENEAVRDF